MNEPRPYRNGHDFQAMRALLMAGRKADNGTYYIHTGDLSWWLYYPPLEGDFWDQIYVWDDPGQPGRLLGWALISPDSVGFDVYIQPELRGSPAGTAEMYTWAEERAMQIARRGTANRPFMGCGFLMMIWSWMITSGREVSSALEEWCIFPAPWMKSSHQALYPLDFLYGAVMEFQKWTPVPGRSMGLSSQKRRSSNTCNGSPTLCAHRSMTLSWISWQ